MEKKNVPQESWRKWVLIVTALGFAMLALTLITQENQDLRRAAQAFLSENDVQEGEAASMCDVGSLCLQEGVHEGGIFGVAQIDAHLVGEVTYEGRDGSETCMMMQFDGANDPRVEEEIGGEGATAVFFPITAEESVRYEGTTKESPASLLVYIAERVGRDTGPCSARVHIVN